MSKFTLIIVCIFVFICGCSDSNVDDLTNEKPDFITSESEPQDYTGSEKGYLFTGSLENEEDFGDPNKVPSLSENPTEIELRNRAIFKNYTSIVDTSDGGGYGLLYGSKGDEEKITGTEYLAYSDDGTGSENVTLMVQIPDSFDTENPCIITGPSPGSRGIYGAVGTAGEWGLKHGCAVAYTDKGTGIGVHDLDSNTVNVITGERKDADEAGSESNFTVSDEDLKSFKEEYPHRVAFRHAHSKQNPQADWGRYVLESIEYAFYKLNQQYDDGSNKKRFTPENTIVIAASISNGGGASIMAAEQDTKGLIDGVAVSEPNISPPLITENNSIVINYEDEEWNYTDHNKSLFELFTMLNIYQPCANLDPAVKSFNMVEEQLGINRCTVLRDKGLLQSDTLEEQAAEAQKFINDYGVLKEQNLLQPVHHAYYIIESVCVTYANSLGRFGVTDNLGGFSFAALSESNQFTSLTKEQLSKLFTDESGIPPTANVSIINNNSKNGPMETRNSISESSGITDQNLDGALYLYSLVTGKDYDGNNLDGEALEQYERIKQGISEVNISGDLHGLPSIIVHGRNDAMMHPNYTSRSYFAFNQMVEQENSNLHYYEITNAHHLDNLNAYPGFNALYIPLHYYYIQALDLMYDHLKNGASLPLSQVVRTTPRDFDNNGDIQAITYNNVPPISTNPSNDDEISFENGILYMD
ncbi:D-(-)-3-hydroxybutyrate oligomer hydrolase [Candidatus Magnetomoraceae bacterium gMMP-15]